MNSIDFDTVIVGGGPAGCSCGITLQKEHVSCCIVDRKKFPRLKLCAGVLTAKSQQLLFNLLSTVSSEKILKDITYGMESDLNLYDKEKLLIDIKLSHEVRLVDRSFFDNYLLDYYKYIGGTTFEGKLVRYIDFKDKVIHLDDGTIIKYKYLIAADGANSVIEKFSGHCKGKNALCLEINVDKKDCDVRGIDVFFNIVPSSYAWAFSKGPQTCIGLVKLQHKKFDILKAFSDFLKLLHVDNQDKYQVKGAMLPFGNYMVDPTYLSSVLFVGDAGGFVEPFTGEGIYYALRTGNLAATSILENGSHAAKIYRKTCQPVIRVLKSSRKYQRMISSSLFMNFFCGHVHNHEQFMRYFYDTHIDQCTTRGVLATCLKY